MFRTLFLLLLVFFPITIFADISPVLLQIGKPFHRYRESWNFHHDENEYHFEKTFVLELANHRTDFLSNNRIFLEWLHQSIASGRVLGSQTSISPSAQHGGTSSGKGPPPSFTTPVGSFAHPDREKPWRAALSEPPDYRSSWENLAEFAWNKTFAETVRAFSETNFLQKKMAFGTKNDNSREGRARLEQLDPALLAALGGRPTKSDRLYSTLWRAGNDFAQRSAQLGSLTAIMMHHLPKTWDYVYLSDPECRALAQRFDARFISNIEWHEIVDVLEGLGSSGKSGGAGEEEFLLKVIAKAYGAGSARDHLGPPRADMGDREASRNKRRSEHRPEHEPSLGRILFEKRGFSATKVLDALSGAHMADLCRYFFLYEFGGLYVDTDVFLTKHVSDLVQDTDFVGVVMADHANVRVHNHEPRTIHHSLDDLERIVGKEDVSELYTDGPEGPDNRLRKYDEELWTQERKDALRSVSQYEPTMMNALLGTAPFDPTIWKAILHILVNVFATTLPPLNIEIELRQNPREEMPATDKNGKPTLFLEDIWHFYPYVRNIGANALNCRRFYPNVTMQNMFSVGVQQMFGEIARRPATTPAERAENLKKNFWGHSRQLYGFRSALHQAVYLRPVEERLYLAIHGTYRDLAEGHRGPDGELVTFERLNTYDRVALQFYLAHRQRRQWEDWYPQNPLLDLKPGDCLEQHFAYTHFISRLFWLWMDVQHRSLSNSTWDLQHDYGTRRALFFAFNDTIRCDAAGTFGLKQAGGEDEEQHSDGMEYRTVAGDEGKVCGVTPATFWRERLGVSKSAFRGKKRRRARILSGRNGPRPALNTWIGYIFSEVNNKGEGIDDTLVAVHFSGEKRSHRKLEQCGTYSPYGKSG